MVDLNYIVKNHFCNTQDSIIFESTFQLWKPVGGHKYKLIWRKAVYPDVNSGGGFRHKVHFTFVILLSF